MVRARTPAWAVGLLFAGVAKVGGIWWGGLPFCVGFIHASVQVFLFFDLFQEEEEEEEEYLFVPRVVDVIPLHLQSCVRNDLSDWTLSIPLYMYTYV